MGSWLEISSGPDRFHQTWTDRSKDVFASECDSVVIPEIIVIIIILAIVAVARSANGVDATFLNLIQMILNIDQNDVPVGQMLELRRH